MGVNKASDRYLVSDHGKVAKSGSSANLGKNVIGLFNILDVDRNGAKAVDTTEIIEANSKTKFEIRQGIENKSGVTRTLSNKGKSTMPFKAQDIKKAWVSTPTTTEQKFDELYIGYDGFDESSSFKFRPGESFSTDITLWGKAMGLFNDGGKYTVRYSTLIPDVDAWDDCGDELDFCTPVDCRKETLNMVKYLRNYLMPNQIPLTNLISVDPVFSTVNAGTTTAYKVMELSYVGFEGHGEIGKVQAQYPELKITKDHFTGKFQTLVPEATVLPAFVQGLDSIIPGCDGCPTGFSEVEGGFVYAVKALEEPTIEGATLEQVGEDKVLGVKFFLALAEEKLEKEVIDEVAGEVIFVGEKGAVCENATTTSSAWVKVSEGTATTHKYSIVLADDCNGSRLEELQERYPELTITASATPAPKNCIRKYETTVITDIQFLEGCPNADVLEKVYESEAPAPFDFQSYWIQEIEEVEAEGLKCGIRITGKPIIMNTDDEGLRDSIPFIATSIRVNAVSGYVLSDVMSLNSPTLRSDARFKVRKVSNALDLDNLGGNMKLFERAGNAYFLNEEYMLNNVYGRYVTGTESLLEGLTQYNTYSFEILTQNHAQGLGGFAHDSIVYHMMVPTGRSAEIEQLHKALAGVAQVPIDYVGQKA